jgi:hypothetical protein
VQIQGVYLFIFPFSFYFSLSLFPFLSSLISHSSFIAFVFGYFLLFPSLFSIFFSFGFNSSCYFFFFRRGRLSLRERGARAACAR